MSAHADIIQCAIFQCLGWHSLWVSSWEKLAVFLWSLTFNILIFKRSLRWIVITNINYFRFVRDRHIYRTRTEKLQLKSVLIECSSISKLSQNTLLTLNNTVRRSSKFSYTLLVKYLLYCSHVYLLDQMPDFGLETIITVHNWLITI